MLWVVGVWRVESLVTCGWRPAYEGAPPLRVGPPMPELCTSDGARLAPPSDCKASFSRRRARSVGVFVLVDHIGVWLCCLAAAVGSAQCRQTTLFPLCISAYSDLNPCVHGDHEPTGSTARAGGGWSEILGSERASLATYGGRPMGCAGHRVVDVSGRPRRCRCMLVRGGVHLW